MFIHYSRHKEDVGCEPTKHHIPLKEAMEKRTEEETLKIVREEIVPKLDSIKDDLIFTWTEESARQVRSMSRLSVEEMYRPFTI